MLFYSTEIANMGCGEKRWRWYSVMSLSSQFLLYLIGEINEWKGEKEAQMERRETKSGREGVEGR